jgi:hypothetical protein
MGEIAEGFSAALHESPPTFIQLSGWMPFQRADAAVTAGAP